MNLFDSHAHFLASKSSLELAAVMDRAVAAGVSRLIAVGGDADCNAGAIALAKAFPERAFPALGFSCSETAIPFQDEILKRLMAAVPKTVAVGEIGLDFHYYRETAQAQADLLTAQLRFADLAALPVIIHTREADTETLRILDSVPWHHDQPRGVIHCFTGTKPFADALLKRGFYISFSGIVTFRNAAPLREVAATIPDDRLLIETDSPYLAPIPHRGEPNEPANVIHVAEQLATLRHTTPEALAALTAANAERLFGLVSQ